MPTISDPTRLSREELLAEWSVREEELRLQFESLRTAQTQSQLLLQRYERIFAYCPFPMLLIDSRNRVLEANRAARSLLGERLGGAPSRLVDLLDEASRQSLVDALRGMSGSDGSVAECFHCRLLNGDEELDVHVVALDVQRPPDTYAVMFDLPGGTRRAETA